MSIDEDGVESDEESESRPRVCSLMTAASQKTDRPSVEGGQVIDGLSLWYDDVVELKRKSITKAVSASHPELLGVVTKNSSERSKPHIASISEIGQSSPDSTASYASGLSVESHASQTSAETRCLDGVPHGVDCATVLEKTVQGVNHVVQVDELEATRMLTQPVDQLEAARLLKQRYSRQEDQARCAEMLTAWAALTKERRALRRTSQKPQSPPTYSSGVPSTSSVSSAPVLPQLSEHDDGSQQRLSAAGVPTSMVQPLSRSNVSTSSLESSRQSSGKTRSKKKSVPFSLPSSCLRTIEPGAAWGSAASVGSSDAARGGYSMDPQ